jgi:hypothetical protein
MDDLDSNNIVDLEKILDKELDRICNYLRQPDSVTRSQPILETDISYYFSKYMNIGGVGLAAEFMYKALTSMTEANSSKRKEV